MPKTNRMISYATQTRLLYTPSAYSEATKHTVQICRPVQYPVSIEKGRGHPETRLVKKNNLNVCIEKQTQSLP